MTRARSGSGRPTGKRRPALLSASLLLLMLALAYAAASFAGAAASASNPLDKVETSVVDTVGAGQETTFWAVLREEADLGPAATMSRSARGQFVYEQLTSVAEQSQAGLRTMLEQRGASYEPFWIVNAVRIRGDKALLTAVASRPEVEQILAARTYHIPKPPIGVEQARIDVVEWGIDRIRAPEVWSTFGDRGEGIVIANIDTGVQYNHPAVVRQYRGNLGGGSFDHNYNWFDPSEVCGSPSLVPCDNNAHGTHTMGTMVGDDGATNQIGVAPGARWIAAKGCESTSCSDDALLRSGQWVLAPTDLAGQNPRPDLRPDIVNNSWGTDAGGDPFYQATVDAWVAAGIFPAFSNGNNGFAGCGSVGAPGSYINSYGVGAFDINNTIAGFSSRGPSPFGSELKPNLSAPGVNVRSSVPTDSYAAFNGTSMAAPHLSGTVALMWSAAPAIRSDITATRTILDDTAIDMSDLSCGGTSDDNNVWGEGRLDAFAAVDQSPRGPTGTLSGTVTDATTSDPIAGATISVTGPADRVTTTNASGDYSFVLPVGTYEATASAFGYASQTVLNVVVSEGLTTDQDFALQPAPSHSVSGHVRDSEGNALAGASVEILGTPIPPATTDATGLYSFPSVPEGSYDVRATSGRCFDAQTQPLVVDGDETLDFALTRRHDTFGYFCEVQAVDYIEATNVLSLSGDDASTLVTLPFQFTFYGQSYSTAHVATNGFLNFLSPNATFTNGSIPSAGAPNAAIYPFWDDMFVDGSASVRTDVLGSAPNRRFVIEWRNVTFFPPGGPKRIDFEVVLYENGRILTQYRNIEDDGQERGNSATLGIENEDGTDAFQYSFNEATVETPSFAVLYRLPPSGFVQGQVTDANDDLAVAGATVRALQGGSLVRQTTTDSNGNYRLQLPLGTYTIEATAERYSTESAEVVLDQEDEVVTQDFVLRTARAEVSPSELEFIATPNSTKTKVLTLRNTGTLDMTWEIRESGGGSAMGQLQWLDPPTTSVATQGNATGSTHAFPAAARWQPDKAAPNQARILVYADDAYHTSPDTYIDQALQRLGLAYTAFYDANFTGFENALLNDGPWDVVVFGNDNFFPPTSVFDALNTYVTGGGKLVLNSWTVGPNSSHPLWTTLGFQFIGNDFDPPDPVHWWQPDHPVFSDPESVPEFTDLESGRYGIYGQQAEPLANFEALAGYTGTPAPNQAAMVLGNDNRTIFKGFEDGQNDADLDTDGVPDGVELWTNLIAGIEQGFFSDVPWLSETPTSGTLAPGETESIQVTVDTTGLAPGVYDARLTILSNSARRPSLRVPVRLIVPAYRQGVNAGGAAYVDVAEGDPWAADREYSSGGYGYVTRGVDARTRRSIAGTEDDPLYQDLRRAMDEYRFDVPDGVYQVELRFAELSNRRPGQHIYDVLIEGDLVLFAHDVSAEVGTYTADDHSFFLPVTDGTLNVRFVPHRGFGDPEINAVRVTDRPDR
jgi:subtilisin family serine protease